MGVTNTNAYDGPFYPNGVTTSFPFTFRTMSTSEVVIVDRQGDQVSGFSFSIVPSSTEDGGTIVFDAPPTAAALPAFLIASAPDFGVGIDLGSVTAFNPRTLNPSFERLAVQNIFLQDRVKRSPQTPLGGGAEHQYPVVNPDGSWGFSEGTGNDPALRADIAAPAVDKGSSLIAFKTTAILDAVARSVRSRLEETASLKDAGAVGDGVADDSVAFGKWLAAVGPNVCSTIPPGTYRITRPFVAPLVDHGNIRTAGKESVTILIDAPDHLADDFLTVGDGVQMLTGWHISGIRFVSLHRRTGATLRVRRMHRGSEFIDLDFDYGSQTRNLRHGLWLDNVNIVSVQRCKGSVLGDGIRFNGRARVTDPSNPLYAFNDEASDVFVEACKFTFCGSCAYHVGGGIGGVYFCSPLGYGNRITYKQTSEIANNFNREIVYGDTATCDGSYSHGLLIDEAYDQPGRNTTIAFWGGSAGVLFSAPGGNIIYIKRYFGSRVTLASGQIFNAKKGRPLIEQAQVTGSITGTTLTVTAMIQPYPIVVGQKVDAPNLAVGTSVLSQISGTAGGPGTYQLSAAPSSAVPSGTINFGTINPDAGQFGHGVQIDDATCLLSTDAAVQITNNEGFGVYASVLTNKVFLSNYFSDNGYGSFSGTIREFKDFSFSANPGTVGSGWAANGFGSYHQNGSRLLADMTINVTAIGTGNSGEILFSVPWRVRTDTHYFGAADLTSRKAAYAVQLANGTSVKLLAMDGTSPIEGAPFRITLSGVAEVYGA